MTAVEQIAADVKASPIVAQVRVRPYLRGEGVHVIVRGKNNALVALSLDGDAAAVEAAAAAKLATAPARIIEMLASE